MCKAAATYKPSSGATFGTYAVKCIAMAVNSYFRAMYAKHRWSGEPCLSLNYIPYPDSEDPEELIDFIPDERVDVENEVIDRVFCDKVRQYAPIIAMHVDQDMTLSEIGKLRHVTKQRISVLMNEELARARVKLTGRYAPPALT